MRRAAGAGRNRPAGSPGRTLVEVIVGSLAAAILSAMLISFQVNNARWSRADDKVLQPIQPVRDAADWLGRDVRIAHQVALSSGKLTVHQRQEVNLYEVTYYLDGTDLKRDIKTYKPDGSPPGTVTRLVARGVDSFMPTLVSSYQVHVELAAKSEGSDPVLQEVEFDLVARLGAMP